MFEEVLIMACAATVLFAIYFLARKIVLYNMTHVVPLRRVMLVENNGVLRALPSGRHVLGWNDKIHRCYMKISDGLFPNVIAGESFPLNEIMIRTADVDFTVVIDEAHPEIFAFKDAGGRSMEILIDRIKKMVRETTPASSLVPGCDHLRALENEFGVHIPYFYVKTCTNSEKRVVE